MSLPHYDSKPPADTWWFFDDALGNLIQNATVEIYLYKYKGPRIKLGETVIDGSLKIPAPQETLQGYEFIIYHPDYGIANVPAPYSHQSHIAIPLVHRTIAAATGRPP